MEKRPGNAVKPMPACVDALFHRHLATNAILILRDLIKVPPGLTSWVFHIVDSNLYQRWVCMFRIPRPFNRQNIFKTVRDISFFPKHVTVVSNTHCEEYPRIRRRKDVPCHYCTNAAPLSYWKQQSVPNRSLYKH